MRLPSGENATLTTGLVCSLSMVGTFPVCAVHTFTPPRRSLSQPPEAMRLPSGENATLLTGKVCPWRKGISCPVCTSHTFISPQDWPVFSSSPLLAETIRLPSGENATLRTPPVSPLRDISCPLSLRDVSLFRSWLHRSCQSCVRVSC